MFNKLIEKKTGAKSLSALFMGTYMTCLSVMYSFADNPFDTVEKSLSEVIEGAITTLTNLVVPLATVAALVAIVVQFLPGISTKATERCKTVIWSCIGTVAVAYALKAIFALAKSIGQSVSAGSP